MYDIDYFCSAKSYYEWFSDGRKTDITETTDENIIRDKIIKTYNPKAINLIPQEFDLLHECERIQKVHLAFLDSILLKSEYEANNNFHYDITILQRYDSIIYPMQHTLNSIVDSVIEAKKFTNPNHIFHFGMDNYNNNGNTIKYMQDIVLISIGNSLDILASELCRYVGQYHTKLISERTSVYFIMNFHSLIFDIFSKNNVEMRNIEDLIEKIDIAIIRDGLEHLDILDEHSWSQYKLLWKETQV